MSARGLPYGPHVEQFQPGSEEILAQLQRILESPQIRESHQITSFLDFIVRETLASRQDGLKEYILGCRIFGRRPDYDPRHDGIVRVQATSLRKRLDGYYRGEGAADPVVIDLPRGGYVPSFRYAAAAQDGPRPAAVAAPRAPGKSPAPVAAFLLGCAVAAVACSLLLRMGDPPRPYRLSTATQADFPQLWPLSSSGMPIRSSPSARRCSTA